MSAIDLLQNVERAIATSRVVLLALKIDQLLQKFDPKQPRVPAGQSRGGQWIGTGGGLSIAGKWNEKNRWDCEIQYQSDILQCRMMLWNPFCQDQARSRMTACMKGNPIPPFFHVGDAR